MNIYNALIRLWIQLRWCVFVLLALFGLVCFPASVFAQVPASFSVQLSQNPIDVDQEVDVTVTALRTDGSIETGYEGTILLYFDSDDKLDDSFFQVPNGGLFSFSLTNQGVQTFSKALKVSRSGEYDFVVSDLTDATIEGKITVAVGTTNDQASNLQKVVIDSPVSGSTVTTSVINVLGRADVARAPLQVLINDTLLDQESETNADGEYNVFLSDLSINSWENTLQVRVLNFEWQVIGKSDSMPFVYNPPASDWLFKGLTVSPSTNVKAGEKFTFVVETDSSINSVQLKFDDLVRPLTKDSPTTFSNDVLLDPGTYDVDVTLILNTGERKLYQKQSTVTVGEKTTIQQVKLVRDNVNPDSVQLSWQTVWWDANKYIIAYGTQDNLLNQKQETDQKSYLFEGLAEQTYFFQITPVDASGSVIGDSSDIVSINLGSLNSAGTPTGWSAACSVQGISVSTSRIGDTYYLIWSNVPWVTLYTVYRSDTPATSIAQMRRIGETTDTKFPYPFDPFAVEDQYAHYAVQATCNDGQTVQVGGTRRVQVGPVTDLFFLLALTLLCYLLFVLYGYTTKQ